MFQSGVNVTHDQTARLKAGYSVDLCDGGGCKCNARSTARSDAKSAFHSQLETATVLSSICVFECAYVAAGSPSANMCNIAAPGGLSVAARKRRNKSCKESSIPKFTWVSSSIYIYIQCI